MEVSLEIFYLVKLKKILILLTNNNKISNCLLKVRKYKF